MPGFRLFYLDSESKHITRSEEFQANDDVDAVHQAEQGYDQSPIELWSGERKIKRWDGPPIQDAPPP